MTATPDEIKDQVLDDVLSGSAEIQIGDRRERKYSPAERLAAATELSNQTKSPFIKVGFKPRSL